MKIFLFSFKMAIKTSGSAQKKSGSVGLAETQLIFFFGLIGATKTREIERFTLSL